MFQAYRDTTRDRAFESERHGGDEETRGGARLELVVDFDQRDARAALAPKRAPRSRDPRVCATSSPTSHANLSRVDHHLVLPSVDEASSFLPSWRLYDFTNTGDTQQITISHNESTHSTVNRDPDGFRMDQQAKQRDQACMGSSWRGSTNSCET